MGKEKKAKKSAEEVQESNGTADKEEVSYEDRLKFVSVISKPMASKKLAKKVRMLKFTKHNCSGSFFGHLRLNSSGQKLKDFENSSEN